MNVHGLTPPTSILDEVFCIRLTAAEALAWMGRPSTPCRHHTVRVLANSPEVLIWCLSRLHHVVQPSTQDLTEVFHEEVSDAGMPGPRVIELHAEARARFLKALMNFSKDGGGEKLEKRLIKLVAKSVPLPREKVKAWMEQRRVTEGVWRELAETAAQSIELDVQIRVPSTDDADFQRRLQEEKMASMKQLAYGASHEINNPLANIASRAQTLLRDESDPERRHRLSKINQQAFRANEMIADMMLFAHPPQPSFVVAKPAVLIRQVIDELSEQAEQQSAVIEFNAGKMGQWVCDPTQLSVAVKALITNSLESFDQGGLVSVELSAKGSDPDWLEVVVEDNGPGFPSETMKHLFDPFYSGREAGRGLGFGLSKAWRIAELHGGEISAESPQHGGARFRLRIPYRDPADVAPQV